MSALCLNSAANDKTLYVCFTYRCLCKRCCRVELYLLIVAVRALFVVYHIKINWIIKCCRTFPLQIKSILWVTGQINYLRSRGTGYVSSLYHWIRWFSIIFESERYDNYAVLSVRSYWKIKSISKLAYIRGCLPNYEIHKKTNSLKLISV